MVVTLVTESFSKGMAAKVNFRNGVFAAEGWLNQLPQPSTAPYPFSIQNSTVPVGTGFRTVITEYEYTYGDPGSSKFWMYDTTPSGQDAAGWVQKAGGNTGLSLATPRNPYAITNVTLDRNSDLSKYLLAADWDSDSGVTTWPNVSVIKMTVNPDTGDEEYTVVARYDFQEPLTVGFTAHCQDVVVTTDQNSALRIFALFIVNNADYTEYRASYVVELELVESGETVTLTRKGGLPTFSNNAISIVPFIQSQQLYLFVPSIGGYQSYDGVGNGVYSQLQYISAGNVLPSNPVITAYVGTVQEETENAQDFHGLTISSNGTVYFTTGVFVSYTDFAWRLYQTTVVALLAKSGENPIDLQPIANGTDYNSYFHQIGVCQPVGSATDYVVFAKGGETQLGDYDSHDILKIWAVGGLYSGATTITSQQLNNSQTDTSCAINGLDITSAGGAIRHLRSTTRKSVSAKPVEESPK
jgi:hypothetical protein